MGTLSKWTILGETKARKSSESNMPTSKNAATNELTKMPNTRFKCATNQPDQDLQQNLKKKATVKAWQFSLIPPYFFS